MNSTAQTIAFLCSMMPAPFNFCPSPFFQLPNSDLNNCTVSPDYPLRMLAIGDSITAGWGDPMQNSYRMDLRDYLNADCIGRQGDALIYLGTQNSGTFYDNLHEGYPGYSSGRLLMNHSLPLIKTSLSYKPNVVLIHAGTNDVDPLIPQPESWQAAGSNVGKMIDIVQSFVPNVTILVAQVCSTDVEGSELIPNVNAEIKAMVDGRAGNGEKVYGVDMSGIGVRGADLADMIHPNATGYRKMAEIWFAGLREVSQRGWIVKAEEVGIGGGNMTNMTNMTRRWWS